MQIKQCTKCETIKSIDNFYKSSTSTDGLRSHCKQCCGRYALKAVKKYRKSHPEYRNKQRRRYRANHPEQRKAEWAIYSAVKQGELPRVSTYHCARPGCNHFAQNYHHWSYRPEHWLNVIPLCSSCHGKLHMGKWSFENPQQYTMEV